MSNTVDFISFVRRGGAPEGTAEGRAFDTVTATVTGPQGDVPLRLSYALPGPVDVRALHRSAVRRLVPAPGTLAAEEEDRPYVEFVEEDLPWRYAPRGVPTAVTPWCLLVVGTAEQVEVQPDGRFVRLQAAVQALHPVGHAARWAHVQRTGGQRVARVLCARTPQAGARFATDTDHVAALVVPWLPDGREAWPSAPTAPVTVRCLLSWRYRTGAAGGFRELADELGPADDDAIGTVTVVRDPDGTVLYVPGALTTAPPPTAAPGDVDTTVLATATDGPPTDRVVVGPPGYGGRWCPGGHEALRAATAAAAGTDPAMWSWAIEVNADLRHRVVAGLGALAGIELQDDVVRSAARAWGPGDAAAELVGGAALGAAATARLWRRRAPHDHASMLRLVGPAMAGLTTLATDVRGDEVVGRTLRDVVARPDDPTAEPFPAAALGPVMGRAVPAAGPIHRHAAAGATATGALVDATRVPDPGPATPWEEHETAGTDEADLDAGHADGVSLATRHADPTDPDPAVLRGRADAAANESGVPLDDEVPPEPRNGVRVDVLVDGVVGLLDPIGGGRVRDRLTGRVHGLDLDRPLAPLEDCPDLDLPAWRWLRDRAPHWLLPGAENLRPGEVVALRTNPVFTEAFLLGLNSQALVELRWRQHPVAAGCTPLRRFWDRAPDTGGRRRDDIVGVRDWLDADGVPVGRLGTHAPPGVRADQLVIVVRSELFRRYPRTLLYLAPSTVAGGRERADLAARVPPESVSVMSPDLTMFAFPLPFDAVRDMWVVVEEQPDGVRFWLEQRASSGTGAAATAADQVRRPVRVIMRGSETVGAGA